MIKHEVKYDSLLFAGALLPIIKHFICQNMGEERSQDDGGRDDRGQEQRSRDDSWRSRDETVR